MDTQEAEPGEARTRRDAGEPTAADPAARPAAGGGAPLGAERPLLERLRAAAPSLRWRQPRLQAPRAGAAAPFAEQVVRRLAAPTAGAPLGAGLRPPVLVVVPDPTRTTGVRAMFGAVRAALQSARIADADLRVLVAGGMHRPPAAGELEALLGPDASRLAIAVHDARDGAALRDCGTTRGGTPVRLAAALFEAGSCVLLGGITPHYFAGFTGGLKGIVPGAAGQSTILANHRRALAPAQPGGLHPACREGNLRGNPVHADLVEAAARAPIPFLVNAVIGAAAEAGAVVSGEPRAAHARGVALVRSAARLRGRRAALVVVTTRTAGRQRDWIQAHKVLRQGGAWTRDGGTLVARLACPDGLGSDSLLPWFEVPEAKLAARVARDYTLHGHTALAMRALQRRLRAILLVSELPATIVRQLGMTPAANLEEAATAAAAWLPQGAAALLLDRAGALLPPATR